MELHVHTAAAESHALSFQTKTLLYGGIASEFDFSPGAQNPLPGEAEGAMQGPCDTPGGSGMAGGAGNGAVGRNFSPWDLADGGEYASLQARGTHKAIQPARISHNEETETRSQRTTPCNSGRCPTSLRVAMEMPLPIR